MAKYSVVSDDLRTDRVREGTGRPRLPNNPMESALLEERTIFAKEPTLEELKRLYATMLQRHGRRMRKDPRTIRRVEGYVLWLEPIKRGRRR